MENSLPVIVRHVWSHNMVQEFHHIEQSLSQFPFISLDTEFPGIVFQPVGLPKQLLSSLSPSSFYSMMKQNVDSLNLIQLGLTLSDAHGNLPRLGTGFQYIWEFNFRDFDVKRDLQNPESISLLKQQGIDFSQNTRMGIDSRHFRWLFMNSGLGWCSFQGQLTWITFHGPYDFAFLIKILIGRVLPDSMDEFMKMVRQFFGVAVYDLKYMNRFFGVNGGLERLAKSLKLERVIGKSHQAGSDSLMILKCFVELRNKCSQEEMVHVMTNFSHRLHGLSRDF